MGGIKEKKVKQRLKKPRGLKTWQLLIILILLLAGDATLLRLDHLKMVELRDAVLAADEAEDDEQIATTLSALKEFVFSNVVINIVDDNGGQKITFGTGPFYLEHQYIRAATAALEEAEESLSDDSNPNGNIYAAASAVCKEQAIQYGWAWNNPKFINCMTSEIEKYPASDNLIDQISAALPSTELYRKNYASPLWAPTLTGFALLITLIVIVVIFIRALIWIFLRLALLFL